MKNRIFVLCILLVSGILFTGCNNVNEEETGKKCGNGVVDVDSGETCDGDNCETAESCAQKPLPQNDPCVSEYVLSGSADECSATCTPVKSKDCSGERVDLGEACSNDLECKVGNGGKKAKCLFYGKDQSAGKKGMCVKPCDKLGDILQESRGGRSLIVCTEFKNKKIYVPSCLKDAKGNADKTLCDNRGDDIGCFNNIVCLPFKTSPIPKEKIASTCNDDRACGVDIVARGKAKLPLCLQSEHVEGGLCSPYCMENPKSTNYDLVVCPEGSRCIQVERNDFRGFCSNNCKNDADCGRDDLTCSESRFCEPIGKRCDNKSECGAGDCVEIKGGIKRCKAVGTGEKNSGDACKSLTECKKEAICLKYTVSQAGVLGACNKECKSSTECGGGYECVKTENIYGREYNVCMKSCDVGVKVGQNCSDKRYRCEDKMKVDDPTKVNVCNIRKDNYGAICNSHEDCFGGGTCLKANTSPTAEAAKGVCVSPKNCEEDQDCGQGMACTSINIKLQYSDNRTENAVKKVCIKKCGESGGAPSTETCAESWSNTANEYMCSKVGGQENPALCLAKST